MATMDDTRTYPKSYKEKTKAAMELFVLCNQFWYLCTSCLTNGRKCNGEAATSAGYFAPTTSASSGSHQTSLTHSTDSSHAVAAFTWPVNQLHIGFCCTNLSFEQLGNLVRIVYMKPGTESLSAEWRKNAIQ